MTVLECRRVCVDYGSIRVLDGIDLSVGASQTLALLGPSGCGKTTLMYAIAGLVPISGGSIRIEEDEVAGPKLHRSPDHRSVGLVFQSYALWPHLDAVDTVAYPLRRAGRSRPEARREALALMERLGIEHLADRRPNELSGGQQQRVGVARALARTASVYLYDEPTAHLDAPLRAAVQAEIGMRSRDSGAAGIYATHDASEALAVADIVALMRNGRITQVGTPVEVYERPHDLWSARLTGAASVAMAHVGDGVIDVDGHEIATDLGGADVIGESTVLIRPEWVDFDGPLAGMIREVWFRGGHTDYLLDTGVGTIAARTPGPPRLHRGAQVRWTIARAWPIAESS